MVNTPAFPKKIFALDAGLLGRGAFVLSSLALGQWLLADVVHIPGGGFGVVLAGAGIWWLSKPVKAKFDAPVSLEGWIRKCREVLDEFEVLEENEHELDVRKKRLNVFDEVLERSGPQRLAVLSTFFDTFPDKALFESSAAGSQSVDILWEFRLSVSDNSWILPNELEKQDALVYVLPLPLMAVDLLWLEQIPEDQSAWLLVSWPDSSSWPSELKALQAQLPHRWSERLLRWNGEEESMSVALSPLKQFLAKPTRNIDFTRQRLLAGLHRSWQGDLERLRRERFRSIQKRTQWVVAGAVIASPVPSTDLLAVAVVNGLMIKEMSKIWKCSCKSETLQVVARHLAGAAVAQGVVEWSGQALLSVAKLDGSSWLAAGALQGLSAAYLTRVVGASMADWLALNNGVAEPDLEALKRLAPQLVANAAEKERLNWTGFLQQASVWLTNSEKDQTSNPGLLGVS